MNARFGLRLLLWSVDPPHSVVKPKQMLTNLHVFSDSVFRSGRSGTRR